MKRTYHTLLNPDDIPSNRELLWGLCKLAGLGTTIVLVFWALVIEIPRIVLP